MAIVGKKKPRLDSKPRPKPTPKAPAASTTSTKTVEPKPAKKKAPVKRPMYATHKLYMAHPRQGVRFYPGIPVICDHDDWLEGQINAGLIKKVS